jgi:acetate kinase
VTGDVVAVNAGSTSVKVTRLARGRAPADTVDLAEALDAPDPPGLVVHRVVHGGHRTEAEVVNDDVLRDLRALTELVPLHQPPALDAIDRCRRRWPDVAQVACFDTAFHATLPVAARTYALPGRLRRRVRVYGFHGLSYAWSTGQVAAVAPEARRVLVAHLGGGASLCGIRDGRSVVTTMGFTPLDGLVMATRSGTLDPGVMLWLARHTGEDLHAVLEQESGLLGLAGSPDMAAVVSRAAEGDADAHLALDVWLQRFLREAGGCIAVLGGLDALVFTGGVGEHSEHIRQLVATAMGWVGVGISDEAAAVTAPSTDPGDADAPVERTAPGAGVRTFVVHAREDLQMLREATLLLDGEGG